MAQLFANNAASAMLNNISNVALSLQLVASGGTKFPAITGGDYFLVTLSKVAGGTETDIEVVRVTARVGDVLTIVRAQEGTTALAYLAGDLVQLRVTAATHTTLEAHVNNVANPHATTKAQVGLANVDNTADSAKPVSTLQAAADAAVLAAATPIAHVGTGGTSHANVVAAGAAGFMTGADKTKLDGVASGATANTGTVTTTSVVSTNGFAGSVATAGTTPAITLSTSVTGLVKGNGTALSAAVVRTDYAEPTTALATGILKNTTTTGAHTIAVAGTDFQSPIGTISGLVKGNGANALIAAVVRTDYAEPTTALATGILKNTTGSGAHTIAVAADFPVLNQSTTGNAATVTTNANLTGEVISSGNATTVTNAAVIGKLISGYVSGSGTVAATDTILQAIQKLNGNDGLKANLVSPTFTTPNIGVATGTSFNAITGLSAAVGATPGTAAVGVATAVARADHVHPVQTTITGNAATVTTNANLTGEVTSVGNAATVPNATVIGKVLTGYVSGAGTVAATDTILQAVNKLNGNTALMQPLTGKDASGGYAGLTLFKINFKNVANTFTSFFTNSNTAARTYTFQDRDGTIADATDLAAKQASLVSGTNIKTVNGNSLLGSGDVVIATGGGAGSSIFLANNFGGF